MKISMKRSSAMIAAGLLTVTTLAATLAMSAPAPAAAPSNPHVLPIQSKPFGKTYAQWVARYWQWGLGIPRQEPADRYDRGVRRRNAGDADERWTRDVLAAGFADGPEPRSVGYSTAI